MEMAGSGDQKVLALWDFARSTLQSPKDTKFFNKLFHQSRLNYIVDALFFVTTTASMFSGLLISKSILGTLGIQLNIGQEWKRIHTLTSDAALILLAVHFALHVKWILFNLKHYLISPCKAGFVAHSP